jgi:hypothetical protein
MPRPYHRHAHAPEGFVSTVALAAETGWRVDRVRRVARQHGLVIAVLNDLFVNRAGFLALLTPRPVPPLPAPTPDQPDRAA